MKTALIVSGQIRDGKKCFASIDEHILQKYKPDVFMHTWLPSTRIESFSGKYIDNDSNVLDMIELYKPKSILIEDMDAPVINIARAALSVIPKESPHRVGYDRSVAWECKFPNVYCMYYSIFKAWSLKHEYETHNRLRYDYFIRIRFDVSYDEFPQLTPKINTLQIPLGHSARGGISDLLVCGENFAMDKYCQLYHKIFEYYKTNKTLHPESMFKRYLEEMHIDVERFPLRYYLRGNMVEQFE